MRATIVATCLILGSGMLLCACSAKHDETSTSASTTTSTATSTTAPVKAAMPKAGLWDMTITGGAMPAPMKTKVCIGAPTAGANPFTPPTQPGQTCARNSVVRTATGYAIDMQCTMNGMTVSTKGDVSGDFQSDYKTVMTTRMTGANVPAMMQTARTSTVDAKYLGTCPAGMKPGTAAQGA